MYNVIYDCTKARLQFTMFTIQVLSEHYANMIFRLSVRIIKAGPVVPIFDITLGSADLGRHNYGGKGQNI